MFPAEAEELENAVESLSVTEDRMRMKMKMKMKMKKDQVILTPTLGASVPYLGHGRASDYQGAG